ncbi:Calcineurin-like phosphoesterase domain, ApaH type, partial [Dillenia turbinata]
MVSRSAVMALMMTCALLLYEEWVSTPACKIVPHRDGDGESRYEEDPEDLKVMMVANLLLLGSDATYWSFYFRHHYLSKFFKKSFVTIKPDMLLVLGDVSAKGVELTKSKWSSVFLQFQRMLGPFLGVPFHVILGDRDVGECSGLNANDISWLASKFPGLDSTGCSSFEISNISFVSLNAVALLCGNNDLRFGVERVIERESIELRTNSKGVAASVDESGSFAESLHQVAWRKNPMSSGSGPVLLLHFPLHQSKHNGGGITALKGNTYMSIGRLEAAKSREHAGSGPYELKHTIPANATEYIFQALRPRIVFSAHSHDFCDHLHLDGTREVTVPAITWDAKDDPGFVIAIFRRNGMISVSRCTLARESHVLVIAFFTWIMITKNDLRNSSSSGFAWITGPQDASNVAI